MEHDDRHAVAGGAHPAAGWDDRRLLAELRRVVSDVDGPPSGVLNAARAAIIARDLDGELAVLVADSRATGDPMAYEPVRGDADTAQGRWLLSFEGAGVQVDMEIEDENGRARVVGQFSGTSDDHCLLESGGGDRRRVEVDELGRFMVADVPHGPIRLRCRSSDGTAVTTAWVAV
jgi:hypothetical protein